MIDHLTVYRPGKAFPSVSATGGACSLMCDHCRGHYLSSMVDVSSSGALYEFGIRHWGSGGVGFLLSGGCDIFGRVAYERHILDELKKLKRETGLIINVHPGLVGIAEARSLAATGIDVFSFDMLTDRDVLRAIMHMDRTRDDVIRTYEALCDTGVRVVPHILAGLGQEMGPGEEDAIDAIGLRSGDMAVLIVHIPTKGTPMARSPVRSDPVRSIARYMADRLPGRSLVLGCMRPRGHPLLERDLIEMGFAGVVQPTRSTVRWAQERGYSIRWVNGCCAPFPITP